MGKEESWKVFVKILFWLAIFSSIAISYCAVFGLVISPAGATGTLKNEGIIASFAYITLWFGFSILAGYKRYKEAFISAMIYSLLPIIGLMLFVGTASGIGVMLVFIWSAPIQGMCFGNEALIKSMVLIQPLLFLIGYYLTTRLGKHRNS